jgi:microcystin-dependent protein
MSNPYVGEIRMFAGNFAPANWMLCQGQLLPISEYDTLFTLIGTTYGGDGQETFRLPDLGARFAVHQGQRSGEQNIVLGQTLGNESVTLSTQHLPAHSHPAAAGAAATTASAAGAYPAAWADVPYSTGAPTASLAPQQLGAAGGSQPHENRQPYLTVNFIISLFGVFPTQS